MFAINRVNGNGVQYHLTEIPNEPNKTLVTRGDKSMVFNANIHRMDSAWYRWRILGEYIQVAFLFLNANEREFLMTGMTPREWAETFGEDEE